MKKITSLFLLLCLSMATWATKTLYLAPNSGWMTDGAKVAVYYFNKAAGTDGWSEFMAPVAGQTNLYTTTIPDGFPTVIFCRMDGSQSARNWDNKWNKSADLLLPDGKDLFVLAEGWDNMSGVWMTYSSGMTVPASNPLSVPNDAPDVMLQAFYYDSYPNSTSLIDPFGSTGWSTLLSQVDELGTYFDLVWLPPVSDGYGTGYHPKNYSNINGSAWGNETQLRTLISKLKEKNTRTIADIVINHNDGSCGWCCFATMNFGEYGTFYPDGTWLTTTDEVWSNDASCTKGANAQADDGYGDEANYSFARDWDHTNPQVQAMCRAYLQWLKNDVGFDGWRYDYGKGFDHKHINDYNSAAGAYLSVVEYWDGNRDVLKARVDDASGNDMAFDFSTKYNALNDGICAFDYSKCAGTGMIGKKESKKYAVTFVDNHDTFTRNGSEFGGQNKSMTSDLKDRLLQANAYILSMPGIPCVFYPHWVAYGDSIKKMIEARHLTGVHSCSEVKDVSCDGSGYQATIVGKNGYIVLQLGNRAGNTINGFTKHAFGNGYAMWIYTNGGGEPGETEYYLKNNWGAAEDWSWKKMTADEGGTFKLEKVVFGGSGVNYNTAETDEGSTWVALDAFKGDKVAAKDTVTFTLDATAGTITAKLIGKYVQTGGDNPEQPDATKYYLVGSATDWKVVKEAQYTFAATDVEGEFKLATTLTLGQAIKVVGVQGETQTWYPDGEGNEYIVDADHAGSVTIYFRPSGGNEDWAEFGGYIYIAKNTATDLDVVRSDEPAQKLLMNGQLFILRGIRIYTVTGQLVR